jgi:chemotaxis protein CheX
VKSDEKVKELLLTSIIESVSQIIPVPTTNQPSNGFKESVIQSEMGVLVGITGDIYGRILIDGESDIFSRLGESMFGMPLEGEMLHSFVGEFANMIAGNTSTLIDQKGFKIDITPPTVMVGQLQLYGFEQGISVVLDITNVGQINLILLLQN